MRTEFNLDQAMSDLRAAQWMVTDTGIDIDAVCSHPATAHALIEHARHVDDEIRRLRRAARMPVFGRLRADEQGVRARTEHGVPLFQLPLTELGMSQDEVRQLLMGTALYGRPELAVREMYQNAMDACRRRAMRRRYLHATNGSATGYKGEVTIRQRMQENGQVCIECVDNGSGMSRDELRTAFAQAGRRFTDLASFQDEQAAWLTSDPNLHLYPNSRFGIGVFSYFMLASEIVVETVPENADGKLGDPLSVLVSAPSGLLTITRCRSVPAEIANGGTIIRLYLDGGSPAGQPGEPGELGEGLSVLSLLEELIAITEVHLTVEEDGHEPREWHSWEFGLSTTGPARLAFETDDCRGWWTLSDGGVLADGIKTNITLPGLLVDLRGPHAPSIRADRNQLLDWDQAWVIDQFIAAADTVVDWNEATLVWMWQISILWPRLGQRLFNVLCGRRPEITIGIRQEPRTRVDLRVVGAMPYYEIIHYIHGPRLRSPFVPIPSTMRAWLNSEQADELEPMPWWPDELWVWEQKAWEPKRVGLGYLGLSAKLYGASAIESIDGYPVPDPIDAALMCEPPDYRSKEDRDRLVSVLGFLAGASRSEITPHEACRRIRRFAISGLHFPSVDARDFTQAIPDPMLLDMLVKVISFELAWMSGSSRVGYWLRAAMIATYELRRPLADAKALFEYISRVGLVGVPELSGMAHERIPTYTEMQLFCQGGTGAFEFIQKLRAAGRSRANEFLKVAEHYEPLLADYGLTLSSLRAGYDDDFVEIERAARYDASDIQAPDQFSALAEALRLRGSTPKSTDYVEFSALAKTAGVEVAEAARWINSLQEPPILVPDLDWDSLRSFELHPLQRLILRRDSSPSSSEIALSGGKIDFSLLIHRAAELNESLSDIALVVRSMECIGIRVGFSDPVPDIAPDKRDVLIVDTLCKDGISCLLRLLSSRGKSSRATPLPPIARIAIWVRWVCSADDRLPTVIDALEEFTEDLVGGFSSLTESIISSINNAEQDGNLKPAELIGIAGWAGISIATLRLTVAPFDRLLAAVGVAPAWFPDPIGTPPDWLDVALVDLLDAWPEKLDGWTEEIADFLVANVMADQSTIKERYDRWHDILVADLTQSDASRSSG